MHVLGRWPCIRFGIVWTSWCRQATAKCLIPGQHQADLGCEDSSESESQHLYNTRRGACLQVDTACFESHLSTAGVLKEAGHPDLLIRTSGEQRLSNFLLWELAYTELYFTESHWPDFDDKHLLQCLVSYGTRDRRYGIRR